MSRGTCSKRASDVVCMTVIIAPAPTCFRRNPECVSSSREWFSFRILDQSAREISNLQSLASHSGKRR